MVGRRHSIWQIVLHMVFWRDVSLRRVKTGKGPTGSDDPEVIAGNFPVIPEVTEPAWAEARRRLEDSQERVAAAFRDPDLKVDRLMYLLPHDSYHVGQINYLRAMQGLKPLE